MDGLDPSLTLPFQGREASAFGFVPVRADLHLAGIALGANLGDPLRQMGQALEAIGRDVGRVTRVSSLWRTPPWGVADQPPFLNACALIETALPPLDLLAALKAIERALGRSPGPRWGPRPIDLDILFFDDLALRAPSLTLPHKHLFERAFVLAPLAELGGRFAGRSVADALASLDVRGLEKLQVRDWPPVLEGNGMGEHITLRCDDGVAIDAWLARPHGPPKGGIVVLQEIFGVNHHIRAVATRFAQAGYLAVAPALFDRVEKNVELGYDGSDMQRAIALRAKTALPDTLNEIAAAVRVAGEGGKIGVVGYCWGGSLAWAAAAKLPGLAAAVGYYGGMIASMVDETPRVPVILHFGAHDKHIPLADVEKIRDAHPAVPVYVYDADHGFNCDERASYDEAAARVARARTMAFFAEQLGGER